MKLKRPKSMGNLAASLFGQDESAYEEDSVWVEIPRDSGGYDLYRVTGVSMRCQPTLSVEHVETVS